jgi:hypothetical protein
MVSAVEIPWHDVQTRGYVVVPGFLSAQEIALLVDSFGAVAGEERKNPNFNTRYLPVKTRSLFAPKILPVARRVSPPDMVMNKLRTAIYYATRLGVQWEWHTDSTSHYIHPHYLNFWIPLIKPHRNRSGLSIVDFESLGRRFPEIAKHFVGRGATRVVVRDGKTVFHDNATLKVFEIPDPDVMTELAVTPDLGPGDLLLLRSDVFHRSQDGETERLAISFRVVSSTAIVSRQMLMAMGAAKFNNMARMRTHFAKRFATFEIAQRDELTSAEYDALFYELEAREAALCERLGVKHLNNGQFEDMIYEMRGEYARRSRPSS